MSKSARREIRRQRAEAGAVYIRRRRNAEVRVIEDIEQLRAQLENDTLGDLRLFDEIHVDLMQAGAGTTVFDPQGAVVPSAQVTATDSSTGAVFTVKTSSEGTWNRLSR